MAMRRRLKPNHRAEETVAAQQHPPRMGLEMYSAHFPDRAPIDAYGNGGFRFADMSHKGSILALPSGIYGWPVTDAAQLTPPLFTQAVADAADLELLLIGTGPDVAFIDQDVRDYLSEGNVRCEIMQTGAAVRTYNVLLAENRLVGAALIAVV